MVALQSIHSFASIGSRWLEEIQMPVIVVANPKGGGWKKHPFLGSRTALASQGASVTLIDCDPNRPIMDWKTGPSASTMRVIGDVTESTVISVIQKEAKTRQFVIVDLEGTAAARSRRSPEPPSCLFPCKEALSTPDRQVEPSTYSGGRRAY